MKNYSQIIKTWYEKMVAEQVSYEKVGLQPTKDWKIMLSTTSILLILMAVFAFYFYVKIENGEIFVVTQEDSARDIEIDTTLLKKVVDDTKERADYFSQIKLKGLTPSDPSL